MEGKDWFRKFDEYMSGKEVLFPQLAEQAELDALATEKEEKKRLLEEARQKRKAFSMDPNRNGKFDALPKREIGKNEYWHN